MREEIYDIGGMHCAACSSAVERVTGKLSGVESSSVNLPMNRLTIVYDEKLCGPEAIIKKIERAGFTARLHTEESETARTDEIDGEKAMRGERISLVASVGFAGLLLFISMGSMVFPHLPLPDIISMHTHPVNYAIVQMLLAIPVLFIGRRFFTGGFNSLFHGNPNMDTLVALSSTASFIYSLVTTLLISDSPHMVHSLYFESAAVVVALVSVGKYLEASSREKTKGAITKLMKLAPDTAILVDANGQREVKLEKVNVGDTVLVKPGVRVPLDGVVTSGAGSVNEAMLTGESLPVDKSEGSEVTGGSVSVGGAFYVRVTRTGSDTTLAKIIKFVEDAQGKKAPISKIADKVAGVFVPIVIAIALVSAGLWLASGAEFSFALKIFTCILVIACPCAMGLATPTAIIVGTGLGASHGILIRSGEALETAHKVTTVIFDKTGTITEGKPSVTDILSDDANTLWSTVRSLEKLSDHPLSRALCKEAAKHGFEALEEVSGFTNINGRGLTGKDSSGTTLMAGNAALMSENGVDVGMYSDTAAKFQRQGKSVVFVSRGDKALGVIALSDTIKSDAAASVAELKGMGVKTVLLTGDNRAAADYIGAAAGVDETAAEVLPEEKAKIVEKYQKSGEVVMMVGDGINDAPALVQADTGCAIGSGSDIAIDSADIVLMKPELMDVCRAVRLSRLTIRNIKQNLFWAFCYNILGIPIAAGALYPMSGILLSPMVGGLAMSLSSLFVVTNALRLKGKKI